MFKDPGSVLKTKEISPKTPWQFEAYMHTPGRVNFLSCSKCGYVYCHSQLQWVMAENFGPYTDNVIKTHKCKPNGTQTSQ